MRPSHLWAQTTGWYALNLLLVGSLGLGSVTAIAAEVVTMEIETQALDLDSGAVLDPAPEKVVYPAEADIGLAYHADRTPHAVVFPVGEGVELAFLSNTGFDSVTAEDVANLSFSSEATDLPFSASDCVVIRTAQGAVYKLGNASESAMSVTFNYAAL